jgi:hypothetical protein
MLQVVLFGWFSEVWIAQLQSHLNGLHTCLGFQAPGLHKERIKPKNIRNYAETIIYQEEYKPNVISCGLNFGI